MIIRLDGDGLWFLLWQTGSIDIKPTKRLDDGVYSPSVEAFASFVETLPHPIPPSSIVNRFKKHRRLLEGIV